MKFLAGRLVQIFAALLLLVSIFLPYYDFLDLAVCAAAISLALRVAEIGWKWTFAMVAIVLVFNPLYPPPLRQVVWTWVYFFAALVFLACPPVRERPASPA